MTNLFDLTGKVAIITGGAGLLGHEHVKAIADAGGTAIVWDTAAKWDDDYTRRIDITSVASILYGTTNALEGFGRIDILINNAAINSQEGAYADVEHYPVEDWDNELSVGLTGAYLCSRTIGAIMAKCGGGVIVNIGSDFAHIAPDPKCYAPKVKPASYSVVKHGLLGLTRYLAAYWAEKGVRVNMLSPGGVENGQGQEFVSKIAARVPMGRMAQAHEFQGALVYLCSDASKFMTGQEIIVDGGRSII